MQTTTTLPAIHVKQIYATLPAADINRAKRWYEESFGWRPVLEREDGILFEVDGNNLFVYPSRNASTNKATAATFLVDDARRTADHLRQNGVKLLKFDMPDVMWEDDLARLTINGRPVRSGWFADSEGNIISFGEYPMR